VRERERRGERKRKRELITSMFVDEGNAIVLSKDQHRERILDCSRRNILALNGLYNDYIIQGTCVCW
jgi:hypothetical protein